MVPPSCRVSTRTAFFWLLFPLAIWLFATAGCQVLSPLKSLILFQTASGEAFISMVCVTVSLGGLGGFGVFVARLVSVKARRRVSSGIMIFFICVTPIVGQGASEYRVCCRCCA